MLKTFFPLRVFCKPRFSSTIKQACACAKEDDGERNEIIQNERSKGKNFAILSIVHWMGVFSVAGSSDIVCKSEVEKHEEIPSNAKRTFIVMISVM
jgi:hypothetical protein